MGSHGTLPGDDAPQATGMPRLFVQLWRTERRFFALLLTAALLAALAHDRPGVAMWLGFALAGYSAIANDSIQTIGTFIASNRQRPWWQLWAFMGAIFLGTLLYGWSAYEGDVSYGRLQAKGFDTAPVQFSYLQVIAPLFLMVLTRLRMPVSTTFLLLSCFTATSKSIFDMVIKSVSGYAIACAIAILVWHRFGPRMAGWLRSGPAHPGWLGAQWITSGLLWSFWLQQDLANIAVYLPRRLDALQVSVFAVAVFLGLGLLFWQGGDRIQAVVNEKSSVIDVRAATIIDAVYSLVLFVFKHWSKVPMSTTWVFIGILAGRELALALTRSGDHDLRTVWRMTRTDLRNVTIGLLVSTALAAAINPAAFHLPF